jgi:hypothetical protein
MLQKLPNTGFYENPFCCSSVLCYKQTDIYTEVMEPIQADTFFAVFLHENTKWFLSQVREYDSSVSIMRQYYIYGLILKIWWLYQITREDVSLSLSEPYYR